MEGLRVVVAPGEELREPPDPLTLAENLVVAGLKAHPAENRTALGLGLGLAVRVGVGS